LDRNNEEAAQKATDDVLHIFKDVARDVVIAVVGEIILAIIAAPETDGLSLLDLGLIVEHALTVAALDFSVRGTWILTKFSLRVVKNVIVWKAEEFNCKRQWYRDGGGQYGDPDNQARLTDPVQEEQSAGTKAPPDKSSNPETLRHRSRRS